MKYNWKKVILIFILCLGFGLRVYQLAKESLWFDESYSIFMSKAPLLQIITRAFNEVLPPLYFIILHFWMQLFGQSEFALRFLSVIFGTLSIWILYKLAKIWTNNEGIALVSAFILSVSFLHIYYSQEGRMYALLVLLALASFYFFIRWIRQQNINNLMRYIIFSCLMIYTHFHGFFIIISQNIIIVSFLLSKRPKIQTGAWALSQSLLIVLSLPAFFILLGPIGTSIRESYWLGAPNPFWLEEILIEFSGSKWILSIFCMLIAASIWGYIRSQRAEDHLKADDAVQTQQASLLLVWFLICFCIPYILSIFVRPIFLNRYVITASLPFYLLVAIGVYCVPQYFRIAIILILSFLLLQNYYLNLPVVKKEQWRDVAMFIDSNVPPRSVILFDRKSSQMPFDYYSRRKDLFKTGDLTPAVKKQRNIWLILSHDQNADIIKLMIRKTHHLILRRIYLGIEMLLYAHS